MRVHGFALFVIAMAGGGCASHAAMGRPWVHRVDFQGVRQVQRADLESKLAIEETSWNPLAPRSYLDAFSVEEDRARIEAYYRARGYYDARVKEARVLPRAGGASVDVHFAVEEGEPTRIDKVLIEGADDLTAPAAQQALSRMPLKPGDRCDSDRYLEEKELIAGTLKDLGYPWADVTATAEVDRERRLCVVRYVIEHGPHADVDGIEVRGTAKVDPALVAAETRVEAGDPFRLALLDDVRRRIYHLGLFSSVKLHYEALPARADRVRLIADVKEATFNELRLGFGFGLDALHNEVHVEGAYVRHNFLGGLRTLQLRLVPAYVVMPVIWDIQRHGPGLTAEATLTQPRVGFLSQLQWTVGYDLGVEYAFQYHGPRTTVGVARLLWRDKVTLSFSYNFQLLMFFNTDAAILGDPAQAGRFFGYVDPYRVGWWQQNVTLDLRDSPNDVRKGAWAMVDAEEGGEYAGSAFTYEKLHGDVRGYVPLGKYVVIAARVEMGRIFSQGDLGSPITRRFYLGGPSSHRGFSYGRLSLQVPSGDPGSPPLPVGGDEMFLSQLELRVKLALLRGNWLTAAAFLDSGDVAAPSCGGGGCPLLPQAALAHVDFSRLHHAVGGGLRLKTIIGTLRADLGVRLNRLAPTEPDGAPNPDPGDRFAFHLSVAEAF